MQRPESGGRGGSSSRTLLAGLIAITLATVAIVAFTLRTPAPPAGSIPTATEPTNSTPSSAEVRSPSTPSSSASSAAQAAVKVIVYGDSVTRAGSASFAADSLSDSSWVKYLGDSMTLSGGFAAPGTTTRTITRHIDSREVGAVLVALGANDLAQGNSAETAVANLRTVFAGSSIKNSSNRMVVLALPPENDTRAGAAQRFNTSYEQAVKAEGWTFVDPWSALRAADGTWRKESYTTDGVNPTAAAAKLAGEAVSSAF